MNLTSGAYEPESFSPAARAHAGPRPAQPVFGMSDESDRFIEGIEWRLAYDRQSVQRFAREVAQERARLEHEIGVVRQRLSEAQQAIAARRSGLSAELGDSVLVAQARIAEMERRNQELIEMIISSAEQEAGSIVDNARAEADRMRMSTLRPGPA